MGGNYLLNVGPKAYGTLPDPQVEILKGLGKWMDVNKEAIHSVRRWETHNEDNIWFTREKEGSTVYAMMLQWPENRKLTINSMGDLPVKSVSVMGISDELEWSKGNEGLTVQLPSRKPCKHAFTLEVTLQK